MEKIVYSVSWNNVEDMYHEVTEVRINDDFYDPKDLPEDVIALITAETYMENCHNFKGLNNLAKELLGYKVVLNAVNELKRLGDKRLGVVQITRLKLAAKLNK